MAHAQVPTRIFVISDTHGADIDYSTNVENCDVAIHCGDLTEESKLHEFETTTRLLKTINAPLKLVIAGNHDFTLDDAVYKEKLNELRPSSSDRNMVVSTYGAFGQARALFDADDVKAAGIIFLDEGVHQFKLRNGALLIVYASPYTPSVDGWGFNYDPNNGHDWSVITETVDVVITHGPTRGVMDYTGDRKRIGSPGLFRTIAHAKPLLHCFGHVHNGWGAKSVKWRTVMPEEPSHFNIIDNDESTLIESLTTLQPTKFDSAEDVAIKLTKREQYVDQGYCLATITATAAAEKTQTLFVNSAVQGDGEDGQHRFPWVVDLHLPKCLEDSSKKRKVSGDSVIDVENKRSKKD